MGAIASQITSLTIVYSIVYHDADQRKHQSSASLAFVRGIHREPVNSPHKWPVTRKMFPFGDIIMVMNCPVYQQIITEIMDSSDFISIIIKHNTMSQPNTLRDIDNSKYDAGIRLEFIAVVSGTVIFWGKHKLDYFEINWEVFHYTWRALQTNFRGNFIFADGGSNPIGCQLDEPGLLRRPPTKCHGVYSSVWIQWTVCLLFINTVVILLETEFLLLLDFRTHFLFECTWRLRVSDAEPSSNF